MSVMRVLVADDHPVVQEGLCQVLTAESDIEVVGVAGNGREALEKSRDLQPDVVLLDLSMPEMNGVEATRMIRDNLADTQVVAFSMHEKETFIQRVFRVGAKGYVLKGAPLGDVIKAIREVSAGHYYLFSKIRSDVIQAFLKGTDEQSGDECYDQLSEREQQVFRLIVEGNSTTRIGDLLCVSPKTVEKHRANIMRKLEVSNLVDMVKYAVRIGIIDPEFWKD